MALEETDRHWDRLIVNTPVTEMDQRGRILSTETYTDELKSQIPARILENNNTMVLVLDSLNIFRSSAKCLCDNGMNDLFTNGEFGDFKSYCLFLAVYIPSIIHDHFLSYREHDDLIHDDDSVKSDGPEDESSNEHDIPFLILDVVTKPSKWKRLYQGSPCDEGNITEEGRHRNIEKDSDEYMEVSCETNFLRCVRDVVAGYIEGYEYREGEHKPMVRFSVAIQEQTIGVSYTGPNDEIRKKKIDDISGLDDILAIKKVFAYREVLPGANVRLITCDTQKYNVLDDIRVTENGIKTKSVALIYNTGGNYRQHTVTLPIKSPVVDMTEVFMDTEGVSSLYSHPAVDFWKGISNLEISGVLFSPFNHWSPPQVSLLKCMWQQSSCKQLTIKRKNPLRGRDCGDQIMRHKFVDNQIVLSVGQARSIQYGDGVIDHTFIDDPIHMNSLRTCIRVFNNKTCDRATMGEFEDILSRYTIDIGL